MGTAGVKVSCDWLVTVPLTVGAVVPTGCVVVPPDVEGYVTVVDSPIGDWRDLPLPKDQMYERRSYCE